MSCCRRCPAVYEAGITHHSLSHSKIADVANVIETHSHNIANSPLLPTYRDRLRAASVHVALRPIYLQECETANHEQKRVPTCALVPI